MRTPFIPAKGNNAKNVALTGLEAEITVNTETKTIHVHDGVTPGGTPLSKVGHSHVIADVSGLQQALNDKVDGYLVGLANGVASLGSDGKVPSAQLPSYVDDVIEVANYAALPGTGETGKIYVTLDNNKEYRWSGSVYIELVSSPGSTDALAEGSTNLYFTNARASAAAPVQSVAGRTGAVTLVAGDVSGLATVATSGSYTDLSNKPSLATVATTGSYNDLVGRPSLGTAAPRDVPSAGDAASNEVVLGNDSRLTDARPANGGNAATVTTNANLTGVVTSIGNATSIANGAISNAMLANGAVANLSGTNTGDETAATIKSKLGITTLSGSNTGDQTTITGNAGSATVLQTARNINGVAFDGSTNITVPAAAGTLTGNTLAAGVTASSLTSVGTLSSLNVTTSGSINSITVTDTGVNGANIKLIGYGAVTPNKTIRANSGNFEVINHAYSAASLTVTDAGVLTVPGSANAAAFVPSSSTVPTNGMYLSAANTLAWSTNSANRLTLSSTGDLTATGNVTAYSDESLKSNWAGLSSDFIAKLAGVKMGTFDRKDQTQRQVGVSAQSLQAVLPEAVVQTESGLLSVAYGNAALSAAVALAQEVLSLREELASLRDQIAALQAK